MTNSLFLLLLATVLWGSSFTSTSILLKVAGPITIIGARFLLAAFILSFFVQKDRLKNFYKLPNLGAGFLIFSVIACQTIGLQTATAANTAFITCLYVLIVPIFEIFFLKSKLSPLHFLWVFLALIGMALILDFQNQGFAIQSGDFWTLMSAFLGAGHILWIGHFANKEDPVELHFGQCLWTGIFSVLILIFFHEPLAVENLTLEHGIHFIVLSVGVSFLAFYLQITSQKKLSSTLASLIFLLEAPFAAVFGWILIDQSLSPSQLIGASLILISCILAIRFTPHSASYQSASELKTEP